MKYIPVVLRLFLIIVFLLFSACTKSIIENTAEALTPDIETPKEEEDQEEFFGSMTAIVNGVDFETSNFLNDLDIGKDVAAYIVKLPTDSYIISIVGYDFQSGINQARSIIFYILVEDLNSLAKGKTFDIILKDFITEEGAFAWYGEGVFQDREEGEENGQGFGDNEDELQEIFVKIAGFDIDKKLISGEFNFKGVDSDTGDTYNITSGIFTDIAFELEEN